MSASLTGHERVPYIRARAAPRRGHMRPRMLAFITALLSGAVALSTAEILVRRWAPLAALAPVQVPMPIHEPFPELGWRSKEGRYVWPGYGRDKGREIVMTFWSDGLRATAARHEPSGRPQILVIGCSITQGWALSDKETYAWRLQAEFPDHEILNFGTAGYGTYQSLLTLEHYLAQAKTNPVLVIYGLIEHHEVRNIAPAAWLRAVNTVSDVPHLQVPFATLGTDGTLVRNTPEAYPDWPFNSVLASVRFLQYHYAVLRTRKRATQARAVTDALIEEMARVSRAHGAQLLVVVLHAWTLQARDHYAHFPSPGVMSLNCMLPDIEKASHRVPAYGHPSGVANAEWAECIGAKLRSMGFR